VISSCGRMLARAGLMIGDAGGVGHGSSGSLAASRGAEHSPSGFQTTFGLAVRF
jgi:hypothetical protein